MDKQTKTELKQKLEKELVELETQLKTLGRINPNNPKDWEAMPDKLDIVTADSNEVADGIESYEENTAILKQLEIRLNEVKNALEQMANDSYGVCTVCGETIDARRLEANPAATTCIKHMK